MIYTFEACELDLQRYELRDAGTLVKIDPPTCSSRDTRCKGPCRS
jgi:hypothetical protein